MNLADQIDRNAAFAPWKAALRFADQEWNYAAFAERIAALARGMKSQLGVRRGDRVAVLAMNRPDYLTLLYACARLGAMLVPLNWRLAPPELLYILADADVRALFLASAFSGGATTTRMLPHSAASVAMHTGSGVTCSALMPRWSRCVCQAA